MASLLLSYIYFIIHILPSYIYLPYLYRNHPYSGFGRYTKKTFLSQERILNS